MRLAPLMLVIAVTCSGRDPDERLQPRHLEAVHAQRLEWAKRRVPGLRLGVYQDFRAAEYDYDDARAAGFPVQQILDAATEAGVQVILSDASPEKGILFIKPLQEPTIEGHPPDHPQRFARAFVQYPDEVMELPGAREILLRPRYGARALTAVFRNHSRHILARDLTEPDIRESLQKGRTYFAQDWICDPAGFMFIAESQLGVFDMGDDVPLFNTRIEARLPIPAEIKLLRNGSVVAEGNDSTFSYPVKEDGAYRLQAWLKVDGEDIIWIASGDLKIGGAPALTMPSPEISPNVEVRKNIVYANGDPADVQKHQLDLYLPKGRQNFPVLVFLHGGGWRTGDRSMYGALGNRFARAGIAVAIPSYRLMPKNPHPAQVEDAAAAFAWVYKNAAQFGGDPKRLYLAGHSSGGHLAALLALDDQYLKKQDVPDGAIRGLAAISGVYDVSHVHDFVAQKGAGDASPIAVVHKHAPPFLISYCQWDSFALPKQARDFAGALKEDFVPARLLYIPGENHISEIVNIWKDDDPVAQAILSLVQ